VIYVLRKNKIYLKLRFVSDVPGEWHEIISNHTKVEIADVIKKVNITSEKDTASSKRRKPETANKLSAIAMTDTIDNNADVMVTPCPLCHLRMNVQQHLLPGYLYRLHSLLSM
jgi:hypothetical protein